MIEQPQTSIFAAFGSFAMLVLVEFAGPPAAASSPTSGSACVGAVFITLGTLCSRNAWLAAGAMAVVGFVILFSGVHQRLLRGGATGAILTFVLPVTIPAPNSAIPDRLEGWGLAVGAGICAVMLLWPPRRRADLQRDAAGALRAARRRSLDADARAIRRTRAAPRATRSTRCGGASSARSTARPGPTGPTAALASLPDELDWLLSFLAPSVELAGPRRLPAHEDVEAIAAAAAVLRASAARLEGR